MPEYETRLILFVDFLGFKEHVDRTVAEPDFLDRLLGALADLREVGMEQEVFPSQQMTHFSDSVALSFRIEERSAVFWMLTQIGLAILTLAGNGFLVRGAVTVGQLHHTKDALVGPAMVEAYRMESTLARYPRVIVDPAVIAVARQHRSNIHRPDEEEAYVRNGLRTASDGQLWIDYISYQAYTDAGADPEGYPQYLEVIGQLIQAGLQNPSVKVLRKYAWLHPHYVAQIDEFAALDVQEDEDAEGQRLYVASLPRFTSEMAAAATRIQADDAAQQAASSVSSGSRSS